MKPIAFRQLQEATADLAKSLFAYYKSLRENGFSRAQAMSLVKLFFTQSLAASLMGESK